MSGDSTTDISPDIRTLENAFVRLGYMSRGQANGEFDRDFQGAMNQAMRDMGSIMRFDPSNGYTPEIGENLRAKLRDPEMEDTIESLRTDALTDTWGNARNLVNPRSFSMDGTARERVLEAGVPEHLLPSDRLRGIIYFIDNSDAMIRAMDHIHAYEIEQAELATDTIVDTPQPGSDGESLTQEEIDAAWAEHGQAMADGIRETMSVINGTSDSGDADRDTSVDGNDIQERIDEARAAAGTPEELERRAAIAELQEFLGVEQTGEMDTITARLLTREIASVEKAAGVSVTGGYSEHIYDSLSRLSGQAMVGEGANLDAAVRYNTFSELLRDLENAGVQYEPDSVIVEAISAPTVDEELDRASRFAENLLAQIGNGIESVSGGMVTIADPNAVDGTFDQGSNTALQQILGLLEREGLIESGPVYTPNVGEEIMANKSAIMARLNENPPNGRAVPEETIDQLVLSLNYIYANDKDKIASEELEGASGGLMKLEGLQRMMIGFVLKFIAPILPQGMRDMADNFLQMVFGESIDDLLPQEQEEPRTRLAGPAADPAQRPGAEGSTEPGTESPAPGEEPGGAAVVPTSLAAEGPSGSGNPAAGADEMDPATRGRHAGTESGRPRRSAADRPAREEGEHTPTDYRERLAEAREVNQRELNLQSAPEFEVTGEGRVLVSYYDFENRAIVDHVDVTDELDAGRGQYLAHIEGAETIFTPVTHEPGSEISDNLALHAARNDQIEAGYPALYDIGVAYESSPIRLVERAYEAQMDAYQDMDREFVAMGAAENSLTGQFVFNAGGVSAEEPLSTEMAFAEDAMQICRHPGYDPVDPDPNAAGPAFRSSGLTAA